LDPGSSPRADDAPRLAPFYTRYGLSRTGDREAPLAISPYPALIRHGSLRATVVAAAVDLVGSLYTRESAGTDILFTTDLSIRLPQAGAPPSLATRGRILRQGRSNVTTAVELLADGSSWGYGETTFARKPRADGSGLTVEDLALPRVFESHPLERPLEDEVGVTVVDAARGEVELVLRRQVLNTEATLQGALVALLVERAAEVIGDARFGAPQRVTELDLRYLATAQVGPVRSRAVFIGDPKEAMLRVELRDTGRGDRITTSALLRLAPAR
jgi:acyl-coenzyme A thioesterase PaaI-like protein